MSRYLDISDIKDAITRGIDIAPYMAEADEAIEDLAQRLGAQPQDVETPVHYKVRRYGIAYTLMRACQDRISSAQVDTPPEMNKYTILYGLYKRELKDLDGEISVEMITGSVHAIRDRANLTTATIFRG